MRCCHWKFGRSSRNLSCCPFAENCGTWSHRENRASSKRLWKSCPTTTGALSEDTRCGLLACCSECSRRFASCSRIIYFGLSEKEYCHCIQWFRQWCPQYFMTSGTSPFWKLSSCGEGMMAQSMEKELTAVAVTFVGWWSGTKNYQKLPNISGVISGMNSGYSVLKKNARTRGFWLHCSTDGSVWVEDRLTHTHTHTWRCPKSWRDLLFAGWFISLENPIYQWIWGYPHGKTSNSPGLSGAGLLGPVHRLPEAASGGSAAGNRQRRRRRVRELSHLQDPGWAVELLKLKVGSLIPLLMSWMSRITLKNGQLMTTWMRTTFPASHIQRCLCSLALAGPPVTTSTTDWAWRQLRWLKRVGDACVGTIKIYE